MLSPVLPTVMTNMVLQPAYQSPVSLLLSLLLQTLFPLSFLILKNMAKARLPLCRIWFLLALVCLHLNLNLPLFVADFKILLPCKNYCLILTLLASFLLYLKNIAWVIHIVIVSTFCTLLTLDLIEYITGDRFSSEFVEKRRISLQAYIDRIARHPILQQSPHVQRFLEAEQMSSYDHPRRESHVFENLGDVFLNAFSKVRKPDERFVDIKEAVEKFEQNLINVEKLHSRLLKHQTGLAADYLEFGSSITSLGMMETQVSQPLSNFGNRAPIFSQALTEKTVAEEQYYVNKLREYISYCQSVKDVLKARDQKQVEHEELTNWLLSHQVDRDRTMSTGKSPGITGFFKDKINDLKGVDPEKARQIRLVKLDAKIEELKDAVGQSSITAEAFSKQVVREIDGFQAVKIQDFNKHLQDYIDAQLVYHEKSMAFWEDMVPIADTVSLEEPHQSTSADGS
ncbi:intercellular trafficking and secretion [Batrachochytrium dendrobatidis]|nr:intercellular trafficking and secretion [Batrachochytrium dendrobatidis]